MYRDWIDVAPGLDVVGVRYPGRETLMQQPPLKNLRKLVATLSTVIEPLLDRPFAFFGHSMGSWVAFELTRHLRRNGANLPEALFLSARRAPHIPERYTPLHELDDDAIVDGIQQRYGGIPDEVRAEPELLALMVPTLRADLQVLESHDHQHEAPLECPIHAYGGADDDQVSDADLDAWAEHTSGQFSRRTFPGTHFFLNETAGPALRDTVVSTLCENRELGRMLCSMAPRSGDS